MQELKYDKTFEEALEAIKKGKRRGGGSVKTVVFLVILTLVVATFFSFLSSIWSPEDECGKWFMTGFLTLITSCLLTMLWIDMPGGVK